MKEQPLGTITNIRTGYTQKGIKVSKETGEIILVKPTNFTKDYFFINAPDRVDELELSKVQTHLLKHNEILTVNKGTKISSYLYKDDGERYIATSSFFILTVVSEIIIPEYLYWFLIQEKTKNLIKSFSSGSGTQSFTKKSLSSITVPIPQLDKQREIINFFISVMEEKRAIEQLEKNTEAIYQLQSKKYLDELL